MVTRHTGAAMDSSDVRPSFSENGIVDENKALQSAANRPQINIIYVFYLLFSPNRPIESVSERFSTIISPPNSPEFLIESAKRHDKTPVRPTGRTDTDTLTYGSLLGTERQITRI